MHEDIKRSIITHLYQISRRTRQQGAGGMGVRMRELADELLISPGSATLLADRLVESGWLVRTPDDNDRRGIRLELSAEAGRKLVELLNMKMMQTGAMLDRLELKDMLELDRILSLLQEPGKL